MPVILMEMVVECFNSYLCMALTLALNFIKIEASSFTRIYSQGCIKDWSLKVHSLSVSECASECKNQLDQK